MKLNIGCGMWGTLENPWSDPHAYNADFGGPLPGWVNVDYHAPPNLLPDHNFVQWNLNELPWPFGKDMFEEVRAYHILEHLDDFIIALREIHRVALDRALVDIVVPYAGTIGDAANPYHKHHFNHRTFEHFCRGVADTNDLDMRWRGFSIVRQFLREKGQEVFEDFIWRSANMQVMMRVVK